MAYRGQDTQPLPRDDLQEEVMIATDSVESTASKAGNLVGVPEDTQADSVQLSRPVFLIVIYSS
jgi:hypothetical protein